MRALAILTLLLALARTAAADPGADLDAAEQALADADYSMVIYKASAVVNAPGAAKADVAEAHRLLGLAHFFGNDTVDAEAEFVAYLKLDLDAHLDPSTVAPEAVQFFEDVRARHGAELRKLRPRQRRYALLNLVPPGGQIQNKSYTKAWILGGLELALAATDITTYAILRSWCSRNDFTCEHGGTDSTQSARRLRWVNYVSGIALIGTYIYGVIDGYRGYRHRRRAETQPVVSVAPVDGGVLAGLSMSF